MVPIDKLEQIKQRFEFLEAKMNDGAAGEDIAKLAKEYSELRPVVEQIGEYQTLLSDLEDAQLMLDDPDMKDLAAEELPTIKARIPEVEHALQLALLPKDAHASAFPSSSSDGALRRPQGELSLHQAAPPPTCASTCAKSLGRG